MEELAAEEQAAQLPAGPQIISTETIAPATVGVGACVGAARGAAGGGAGAAGAELGRRLLLAARAGDAQLVLALLAQGAPFTADWLGTSPLHLAAAGGHVGAAGVLLRAGVSRDARTKVERTPLHLAAAAGHGRVCSLLLEHGALLDCRDMLRMTPLHWACARGHAALAALLARRGADPDASCKFGRTPRSLAQQHPATARALAQALKEREGAQTTEEMIVDESEIPSPKTFQTVQLTDRDEDVKPAVRVQPRLTKANLATEAGQDKNGGAAALLRQHGITLLPADDGSTVLSALQSGRTVVLSDAGKLMLKENSQVQSVIPMSTSATTSPPAPVSVTSAVGSVTSAPGSATPGARVVLRARPARSPPRPGVKVFTVNKLTRTPVADNTQIKYVHLPKEAPASDTARAAGARGGVKIIMNKDSLAKLVATAARAHHSGDNEPLPEISGVGPGVVCVPEQFVRSVSARYLRAQLLAAHAAIAALAADLRRARAASTRS